MTVFEETWYNKYMNNMCTLATLNKLINASKLSEDLVNEWVEERLKIKGY